MYAFLQQAVSDPAGLARHLIAGGFKGAAPVAVALLVMAVVVAVWVWRRPSLRPKSTVTARRAFSAAVGLLWARLHQALPDHVVLMGVPLTRFIIVRQVGGLGRNQRRLAELAVDFAVFRADGTVSSVVLLADGESPPDRRQSRLRRKLLERAGVRTVSWQLSAMPTVDAITRQLNPNPGAHIALEKGSAQRGLGAISPA